VNTSRGGTVLPPTFGASLRAARLSRNITLDAVAAHTKINRAFFQDLERDDLSKWPTSQFYRESYLRAYAVAIGLNPGEVIAGFRRELATAGDSSRSDPSSRQRRLTPVTIPIILAVTFVVAYALARWLAPAPQAAPAAAPAPAPPAVELSGGESASQPGVDAPAQEPAPLKLQSLTIIEPEPQQANGELEITSEPAGARVTVNGIGRGTTPVRVQFLPPGAYTIRFVLPGHTSVTLQATIRPDRPRAQVSATLDPERAVD
jgi:cytoskeletal protein RodZ